MSQIPAQLRALAAWLDSHPEFEPYSIDTGGPTVVAHHYGVRDASDLADRAMALGGRWEKRTGGLLDDLFTLRQQVAPSVFAELTGDRESVCTRVVTGSRTVEVEEPDPAAVAALPKVTRTQVIEDVEWRCEPLLAHAEPAA
jgi:hypothetical protein